MFQESRGQLVEIGCVRHCCGLKRICKVLGFIRYSWIVLYCHILCCVMLCCIALCFIRLHSIKWSAFSVRVSCISIRKKIQKTRDFELRDFFTTQKNCKESFDEIQKASYFIFGVSYFRISYFSYFFHDGIRP